MVDALVLCLFSSKQLFKLLISGLCFVFNSWCLSCYCFLSFSGMLGLPSQLPWSLCPSRKPAAGSYMHNIYALNNAFIVFQSNCNGHFLGSLSQSCHSSFFAQCHWLPFFTAWNTNDFSLLFKPCLIYITKKYPSLPLYKWYQYFKAVLYIHFHAFSLMLLIMRSTKSI